MNLFCSHKWRIIRETHTPRFTKIPHCSEYMAERMLYGTTTLLWECEKCQKLRKEQLLGEVGK